MSTQRKKEMWEKIAVIFALMLGTLSGCAHMEVTPTAQVADEEDRAVVRKEPLLPRYGPKKRIVVAEFERKATGVPREVVSGITEMLITALHRTGRFIIVERAALEKLLREHRLGRRGMIREGTEARVGELLGAQALITGAITEFEEKKRETLLGGIVEGIIGGVRRVCGHVAIDMRMFDATTGVILEAHRAEGSVSKVGLAGALLVEGAAIGGGAFEETSIGEAVREAIDDAVFFIVSKMEPVVWQGRVVLSKQDKIYINAGSDAGIKAGNTFDVYEKGKELIDPETGLSLGFEQRKIGKIEVFKVREKFSIATVISGSGGERGDIIRFISQ